MQGNISSNGKVYHKPGDRAFVSVKIEQSKGERYFCSEEDAIAAGWRAAR